MSKSLSELIEVSRLRVGMFVELGIGWMSHPFPTNSFRISSQKQIDTIRALGLRQVRYVPGKSELENSPEEESWAMLSLASGGGDEGARAATEHENELAAFRQKRAALLVVQRHSLTLCEQQFRKATFFFERIIDQVSRHPEVVKADCVNIINTCLDQILVPEEFSIRLLSKGGGGRDAVHAVNVSVLALLLGKAMGLSRAELLGLGLAAFLHDVGKLQMLERVRQFDEHFSAAEHRLYQEHVAQSVELARQMGVADQVLLAIDQHHEMTDGSGFPQRMKGDDMTLLAKILAVVNRYDNLCNPANPQDAMTPHEAVSSMFVQMKHRFDAVVLGAFIRMMGVHPPGSIIQLVDERYAMVVAANAARPLKPRVIVHDPSVPRPEAVILDLEYAPAIGIRRGIRPENLPAESAAYLSPRSPLCYFFEHLDRQEPEPLAA